MRRSLAAAIAAATLCGAAALADEPPIAAATLDAVATVATMGYIHPATAAIRDVRKSKARNGLGYCGEVSLDGRDGFTVFHVILADKDIAASVLRLSDYPDADQSADAATVRRLLVDFGCVAPAGAPPAEPDIR